MKRLSVRLKLTLLYVGTVAALLAVFIGADVVGLKRNLLQHASERGVPTDELLGAWQRALLEHVVTGALLLGLVFVIGQAFIRRALRPAREMARTARAITADDLSLRIDAHGDQDEIGELAHTLNEMIARLEKSFAAIKRFTGDAAHELNTPITLLKAEVEVALRKDRTPDEYRRVLERLRDAASRLSEMVDNLLFLSAADAAVSPKRFGAVALDQVALEACEDISSWADAQGVRIDWEQMDEVQVQGDEALLRRLVANLVSNAVKFTRAGGRVLVSLRDEPSGPMLTVVDTGIGIAAEHLPKVFERFYRVDPSRSKSTGGAGLGLAMAKEIADCHGADLRLSSKEGHGTTVTVAWPRQD